MSSSSATQRLLLSLKRKEKSSGTDINSNEPTPKAARKDEGPPAKDGNAELKWRGDPDKTYSDWKIEVVRSDDLKEDGSELKVVTYHVHKATLACGDRKSEYFDRLFQNGDKFPEGQQSTSRIELHLMAAKAFPDMLDYLYDHSKELNISTGTAASLYHLGEYFEIHQLKCDALEFIKKAPLTIYDVIVEHAMKFHNDTIIEAIGEVLSQKIEDIDPDGDIVTDVFSPPLWLHISRFMDKGDEIDGKQLSYLIAQFVKWHKNSLDTATFEELTSEKNMPFLEEGSSLLFLEVEEFLRKKGGNDVVAEGTLLAKRCAKAIAAGDFEYNGNSQKESLWRILNTHPAMLKEVFFESNKNFLKCKRELKKYQREPKRRSQLSAALDVKLSRSYRQGKQLPPKFR
ncbi:nervous system development [Seminavis robusta]|uniref:Nervous system development n=1 Tax=Seminavis robusta TaxID=568900 RepID=A0A9N8HGL5_9STRA|nr:nervous system development [Seminavis robusta]|eukprot:Sro515_g158260.1 nervous system development (400) ;mRNA; r:20038-21237